MSVSGNLTYKTPHKSWCEEPVQFLSLNAIADIDCFSWETATFDLPNLSGVTGLCQDESVLQFQLLDDTGAVQDNSQAKIEENLEVADFSCNMYDVD
mmetsp:Transcript_23308/g.22918  ORF Transcript_23308/g.22918 Transcript_23308/m.22918 type:complete len:97 (+) Transcript_23308:130-420(+)